MVPVPVNPVQKILGIDRYHGDAKFDWQKLKTAGVVWEYSKASDGNSFSDYSLQEATEAAEEAGILTAAYHFFRANCTTQSQLSNFLSSIKGLKFNLPHFFDYEAESLQGQSVSTQIMRADGLLKGMADNLGKAPIIYWESDILEEIAKQLPPDWEQYPVVIARYTSDASRIGLMGPFTNLFGWQDTDSAVIDGIPAGHTVDRDWFFGSADDLAVYAK